MYSYVLKSFCYHMHNIAILYTYKVTYINKEFLLSDYVTCTIRGYVGGRKAVVLVFKNTILETTIVNKSSCSYNMYVHHHATTPERHY